MRTKFLTILLLSWLAILHPSILPLRRMKAPEEKKTDLTRNFADLKKLYDDKLAPGRVGRIEERISTALAFVSLVKEGKEEFLGDILTYANEALLLIEENFPHQKPFNVMRLMIFALLCKTYYYEKLAYKEPEKFLDAVRLYLELGKLIEGREGLKDVFWEALELISEGKEIPPRGTEEVIKHEVYIKAYGLLKRYIRYYNESMKGTESKKEIIEIATRLNIAIPLLVELKHKIQTANALLPLLKFQIALYYKKAQALNMAANLFQSAYEDAKESDPNLAFISILNASLCYKTDGQEALSIETFVKLKPLLVPEPKVELDKLHQCKGQIREMLHFASDYLSEMLSYNYTASKGLIKDLKLIIRKLKSLLSQGSDLR